MGLLALDEIRNALLEYFDFSFLSWAGQQNANEFSEISPGTHVTMPSFVRMRWQVTSPISVVIDPNNFQIKSEKKIPFLLPSTIFVLLFSPFRLATLHIPSFHIYEFCEYKSPQNKAE